MAERGAGSGLSRASALAWAGLCLALAACAHRGTEQPRQKVVVAQRARDLAQATARPEATGSVGDRDTLVLESVYFDYRQDQLRPDQQRVLLRHAERLKAHPEVLLTLVGHCDDRGSAEVNQGLGARRAERVKKFLADQGLAPERLKTLSRGEEEPVDRGRNAAARARNRRVEFVFGP